MKRVKLIVLSVLVLTWVLAAAAQAAVMNFSEVPRWSSDPTINGVSFWAGDPASLFDTYIDDSWTPENQYLASGRDDGTGRSPALFDTFIGVSLAPGTTSVSFDILSEEVLPGGTTLWLQAFSGGVLKGSSSVFVEDNDYRTLALNIGSAIDTLFIFDDLNEYLLGEAFHIDNFSSSEKPEVPEPSTVVLMATGLAGALLWRRRKNQ